MRVAIVFKSGHLLVVVNLKDFLKSEIQLGNLYVLAGAFPSGLFSRHASPSKKKKMILLSEKIVYFLLTFSGRLASSPC